jgi:DnaJ-class molecular chaperone
MNTKKTQTAGAKAKTTASVCKTCSGSGHTNVMPGTKENTEKMYNESPSNLILGIKGGNIGRGCTTCGGKGVTNG